MKCTPVVSLNKRTKIRNRKPLIKTIEENFPEKEEA